MLIRIIDEHLTAAFTGILNQVLVGKSWVFQKKSLQAHYISRTMGHLKLPFHHLNKIPE